jgi:hypothetical protein
VADAVVQGTVTPTVGTVWSAASVPGGTIQRTCAECEEEEDEQIRRAPREGLAAAESEPASAEPESAVDRSQAVAEVTREQRPASEEARSLLVDDNSEVGPGQQPKSQFLATLRAEVCATVDAALEGTGKDSHGCPWIDHWLGYYETRGASEVERSLRRYAPEARSVSLAADYIPFVTARVRRSAETFASTGEITGAPADMPADMGGGGLLASFGGMFFKARPGGAREPDPASVRDQLGSGQSLPSAVRARMEPAFGTSFARVRLHADADAAQLSDGLNARAFTLGHDVVFGTGEYQPGTLAGDALIAHELAHVVQQRGHVADAPQMKGGAADRALEEEADRSAVGAVAELWGGPKAPAGALGQRALPSLRSGLRLQRCGGDKKPAVAPNLQTDKALRQSWDVAFQKGLALLNESLAKKGEEKGCRFVGTKPPSEWKYDDTNWRQITNQEEIRKYKIAFVPRKQPHVSVDELFNHLERWECDCALFAELTWLYAWRHTLSDKEFDAKFSNLRLRPQETEGLERETHVRDHFELGLDQGNFDAMWNSAPVGTKVNWMNHSEHARSPWRFENAVKSVKGRTPDQDRYDAHPLGSGLTEKEVMRGLAASSADFPGHPFVITDQAIAVMQGERLPSDLIKALEGLKNQVFIGKEAFVKALAAPFLVPLRARDPDRYLAILNALASAAHLPATPQEEQDYIDKNIKRHEFQIPK